MDAAPGKPSEGEGGLAVSLVLLPPSERIETTVRPGRTEGPFGDENTSDVSVMASGDVGAVEVLDHELGLSLGTVQVGETGRTIHTGDGAVALRLV
jgi:hypothetical protein